VRIEVKICGLTNRDDALAALEAGADYLGFVLYSKSPRGIDAARLAQIVEGLPGTFRAVAVFVNEPRANVERLAGDCGLHAVQIHGDERSGGLASMAVPVWRALRISQGVCTPVPESWPAARYVVDAAAPGIYGGSGQVAEWSAARALAERYPVMLAGGLTPDNVADAIRAVRPVGVDVASGVEVTPGRKDWAKVRRFIAIARATGAEPAE
jgi:phosphoribosylanthranilate isomerase